VATSFALIVSNSKAGKSVPKLDEISLAYADHGAAWKQHLGSLSAQVETLLENHHLHGSIKQRVKTLESLSEKLSHVTRSTGELNPTVRDVLGLRVVVPFQEEVERVVELLRQHFNIEQIERKSEKLTFREFAYDSVHVEIPLGKDLALPGCCKQVVEVQVRTILQDAWAEVEHELIYKSHFRFPNNDSIRKKLAAVNASLSLADMIFQEIRDAQKEMARWGQERFQSMLDKATELVEPVLKAELPELPQATLPGIELPGASTRMEVERNLMAGLKAHNEKDYRTAIDCYSQVLACDPELAIRAIVFNHRGMAYFMQQQESLALSDFNRSFQCDKNNYRALNYRAMVLRRMGYVEPALESFTLSLELAPMQAEVYFLRAQTLVEIEETDRATADLRKTLELEPQHKEAQNLLLKISA
jgi:ppGpp synthetase/RelA/SpoT-type nucleotidyltranferase/regulator of sirC expression with transglutaminase-like and TPR domain